MNKESFVAKFTAYFDSKRERNVISFVWEEKEFNTNSNFGSQVPSATAKLMLFFFSIER